MAKFLSSEILPLVNDFYDRHPDHSLSPSEREEFATKLEERFSKHRSQLPTLIHNWHYFKDTPDSEENTLGNSGINPFPPNILHTPATEGEIIEIIKTARVKKGIVRVIGAAHSSPSNIILDAPGGVFPANTTLISLTKLRGVTFDTDKKLARVKAGTNLDVDPENPDSTQANGLARILQNVGYALPETGGITHQTIGGFLSTGSAGGSLLHSFHDAVYGFSFIDGTGTKHTVTREDPDTSLFEAVGVSVGLCGIITEVTISLIPTFNVTGTQQASSVQPLNPDWTQGCPVNLFGGATDGVPGVVDYFKDPQHEYMRMLYWPQPDLPPRVQIWTGKQTPLGQNPIKPYVELSELQQLGAATALWVLWQFNYYRDDPLLGNLEKEIAGKIIGIFLPLKESVDFSDVWFNTLPMDNSIKDSIMPTCFAEFWVDIDKTADAINTLRDLNNSNSATIGNFFTEFYSAKKSPFWLSPSFTGDKFRLDVNFFQYDTQKLSITERYDPKDFFQPYFEYFDQHGPFYTSHLGKYLPPNFGRVDRLRKMYPKYDDWMAIRAKLDPDQIFVNNYWRKRFLIPPVH